MARCKFKCKSKTEFDDGLANIHMEPVQEGSEENKQFFKYTPSGFFDLTSINPEVAKEFQVGKEYYIDITQAK